MQSPNIPGQNLARVGAPLPSVTPARHEATGGPSFQALLERLEQHASGLAGRVVDEPAQLSGAVDEARTSLNDALDLGRDLLEAYREVRLGKAG